MTAIDQIFDKLGAGDPTSNPLGAPEQFFDSIGLMRGEYAPVGRAAFGVGLGTVVMFAIRPSWAFEKDGTPKPWSQSRVPWWTVPVGLGIVCGVFI